MKNLMMVAVALMLVAGCSSPDTKQAQVDESKAINCKTAEADIRSLNAEKAHASQEIAAGVTSIVPVGLVANLVKGTEGSSLKVGTGEYNQALDQKIASIKQTCGIN